MKRKIMSLGEGENILIIFDFLLLSLCIVMIEMLKMGFREEIFINYH